jgi:hypothetical protein
MVKLEYETAWNGGRINIQADSLAELTKTIEQLQKGNTPSFSEPAPTQEANEYPTISPTLGCADAIQALLATEWGNTPRTESELTSALKFNSLHYSHGTISSILFGLFRKQVLRRPIKKHGSYAFVLANKEQNPENQDN